MPLLLCIDTSTTDASVALAKEGELLCIKINHNQKEHASFLQPAIQEMMVEMKLSLSDLQAIAVTSGPGSYTGLRIGFASAKGLCYALQIPLITISTTLVMSAAAIKHIPQESVSGLPILLCPMIDARRLEVFTAIHSPDLTALAGNSAVILNPDSFADILQSNSVYFFGNGAYKWKNICRHQNAFFAEVVWNANDMLKLAYNQFQQHAFTPLAHAIPDYGKDFNSTVK